MIIPDNPIIEVALCGIVGVLGPMLTIAERKRLPLDTPFGIKWRKIKLFEAILEIVVATIGVTIVISDVDDNVFFVFAFILLLCIGWIRDAFIKDERKQGQDVGRQST